MTERTPPPESHSPSSRPGTPAAAVRATARGRGRPGADDPVVPIADGGTTWIDLTGFQRDLVRCIRRIDDDETIPTGRTIKEEVEVLYEEEINHGRLYQNLNHLLERGCIDKKVVDGRTNAYYLTDQARSMLDDAAMQFVDTCGIQVSPTES